MNNRWSFILNRLGEQLWFKPLLMCAVSIMAALLASVSENLLPANLVPDISRESIKTLLSIISSSMLVIATFAVGSMVSAYASAASTATPRSFALVVADDVSQNALSAFIGAFIFSIVALVALLNGFYGSSGRFVLFVLTLVVFGIVIVTFVRWVDRIARLGRLETTVRNVEAATIAALEQWRQTPHMGGIPLTPHDPDALAVCGDTLGYIQRIELADLQAFAEETGTRIEVAALPGAFATAQRELAYVIADDKRPGDLDLSRVSAAFRIGVERTFDEDPRFGLVVLSEIASRALSPGINDSGTAIQVTGTLLRIFTHWGKPLAATDRPAPRFDRVAVPELSAHKMFDDAFRNIARDGAGAIEVIIYLLKALHSLAASPDPEMRQAAREQARRALARAEKVLDAPQDLVEARELARFAQTG